MCMDIMIREKSSGIFGVLDLIKDLSNEYGSDIPFKDDELFSKIETLSSTDVATTAGQSHASAHGATPDNRRMYDFSDRVAELAPEESPFFVYLSKIANDLKKNSPFNPLVLPILAIRRNNERSIELFFLIF